MAEASPGHTTGNVNGFIVFCAVSFVFFTLSLVRYVFVVFTVWSLALGVALGFLLLSNYREIPNLLILLSPSKVLESFSKYNVDKKKEIKGTVCTACGAANCPRHRPEVSFESLNPWEGLEIPETVDKAFTEFLEILLRTHVYAWYWDLSHDQRFVDEMRKNLRFLVSVLVHRIKKIDVPKFLLGKCLKRFMVHLDCYARTRERVLHGEDLQMATLNTLGNQKHFALENEATEVDYVRCLSETIIPYLLQPNFLRCRSAIVFIRELLTNIILVPTAEKIADPDFVNQLLLVLLSDESLKEPTRPPSPNVKILENFAKARSTPAITALNLSVFDLIHDPKLLLPFMHFMRKEGALNVLQFCLDIEDFNKRSLAPELSDDEQKRILKEAQEIHFSYFRKDAVDRIDFPEQVVQEFEEGIASHWTVTSKLRTAEPLFKAYEYAFNLIEYKFAPLFHESDEFYRILCGPREVEQPKKEPIKIPKKKFMPLAELTRLANRIKMRKRVAKEDKSLAIFLDEMEPSESSPELLDEEEDEVEDFSAGLITEEDVDVSEKRDLSYWHITIPRIESIFERNKKVYVFVINIESIGTENGIRADTKWQVLRKYNEFFVLDSKLRRFHGTLHRAELPGKRTILKKDLDFLATCRLPFQEYLQSLVRNPVLRGSGLLHIFLSPGSELTGMFEPESMGREAGRKIQSIKSKLVIERGQNLDEFLQAFLASAEPPKKKIPPKPQNEKIQRPTKQRKNSKLYLPSRPCSWELVLGIFWRFYPQLLLQQIAIENTTKNLSNEMTITDYIIYSARSLLKVSPFLHHVLIFVRFLAKNTLDYFIERFVSYKFALATQEDQIVDLTHLLRDVVFFDNDPPRTDSEKVARRDETFEKMMKFLPDIVKKIIGNDTHEYGIRLIFEVFQHPKLNKQLVYTLLDELVVELFPEISTQEASITNDAQEVY
ncbi:sorting nexin-14-like [Rhopilema esculentum]|uniref:sorting nexin-14-like n=1 Tax=Rhopilema esculentum TaxID=499914 RepID=UPI0031D9DB6F